MIFLSYNSIFDSFIGFFWSIIVFFIHCDVFLSLWFVFLFCLFDFFDLWLYFLSHYWIFYPIAMIFDLFIGFFILWLGFVSVMTIFITFFCIFWCFLMIFLSLFDQFLSHFWCFSLGHQPPYPTFLSWVPFHGEKAENSGMEACQKMVSTPFCVFFDDFWSPDRGTWPSGPPLGGSSTPFGPPLGGVPPLMSALPPLISIGFHLFWGVDRGYTLHSYQGFGKISGIWIYEPSLSNTNKWDFGQKNPCFCVFLRLLVLVRPSFFDGSKRNPSFLMVSDPFFDGFEHGTPGRAKKWGCPLISSIDIQLSAVPFWGSDPSGVALLTPRGGQNGSIFGRFPAY